MKVIRDSNKEHWAIGKQASCPRCETIVEFETMRDFRSDAFNQYVTYECPRCGLRQKFYKPVAKIQNPLPCVTGTEPEKWHGVADKHERVTLLPKSEVDWMGNTESQQERFGK